MLSSFFQTKNQKIHNAAKQIYEELIKTWKEHADGYSNTLAMSEEKKLGLLEKMIAQTQDSGNFSSQDINKELSAKNIQGFDDQMIKIHEKVMADIDDILKMNSIYIRLTERYKRDEKTLETIIEDWYEYLKMIYFIELGGRAISGVTDENGQLDIMRKQSDAATKKDEIRKRLMSLLD